MRMFSLVLAGAFLTVTQSANAQEWVTKMQDPDASFYEVQAAFNNYWSGRDNTEKGKGYKVFKRWEHFVERRVYPSGDLSLLSTTAKNYQDFYEDYQSKQVTGKVIGGGSMIASTTWTAIGPMGAMSGSAGSQLLKSGRLNFITIDPTNSNNLWVGAPAGGLWKSTNGGTSWTTNTDNLPVIGCSDLAIDPTNTSVMYLATGDGDASDTRSIGVLKSTNAGATWTTTGLSYTLLNNRVIRRLIINPSNTQILLAATSQGIYRTTDGGGTWTLVSSGSSHDLEFKPGNPNTVYATSGSSFKVSTNAGASFTTVTSGIVAAGANRLAIAVTAADAAYVYVLASNSTNSGFLGLYRSVNSGVSFTQMSSTPNLLGWSSTGGDTGGQGWYDLCIAASPLNKDEVVTGGVNVWRSTSGGASWSIYGHWVGSGAPFTHADHHDLEYTSTGTLYNVNDGTVYRRTSTGWQEISGTMNISQIYRLGMSSLTANKWITGHQDNGTSIWNGTTYNAALGGDGMDCFFDRTNDANVFAEYQNGGMQRSTNGGMNWTGATTGLSGTAPWLTVWKQDPSAASTLYCGRQEMFKSTNLAVSWTQMGSMPITGSVREFAIAPSNNQVIYVLKSGGIIKTTNGGTNWTNVTGTVPVGSAAPEYICIDPSDPNNAWVVLSGYSSGNKVFMTTNGGTSWTNVSGNLPNIPANCCKYEPGSNDRIYVGMDVGIYYKDNTSSTWTLYNQGLPNVPVSEIEISPASPTLLHAATYGRGVWVASTVGSLVAPVSIFTVAATRCAAAPVTFSDQSSNSPTAWSWSVTPSAGITASSYTVQNPIFTFPSAGIYTVKVQAANSVGPGSVYTQTVAVAAVPVLGIAASASVVCAGFPVTFTASGAATYAWSNGGGVAPTATFTPSASSVYTVTGTSSGCSASKTVGIATGVAPNVTLSGDTILCFGKQGMLVASGALSYTWTGNVFSPSLPVSPTVTTVYNVMGSNGGCVKYAAITVSVIAEPVISIWTTHPMPCENDTVLLSAAGAVNYTWMPTGQTGSTVPVVAGVTTTFIITGTDEYGCAGTTSFVQEVEGCTSIKKHAGTAGFNVFPNPAGDFLSVKSAEGLCGNLMAEIYDVSGRLVIAERITRDAGEFKLDLRGLPPGAYILRLQPESGVPAMHRVIKE